MQPDTAFELQDAIQQQDVSLFPPHFLLFFGGFFAVDLNKQNSARIE